jgi:anti-sigma factor RsiW
MSQTSCFQPKSLIDYVDGKLAPTKRRAADLHLAQCEVCQKNWRRLKAIDALLAVRLKQEEGDGTHTKMIREKCFDNDLLYKYLEGLLSASQAALVEEHLSTCANCLAELASLIRNAHVPMTAAEQIELNKIRTISQTEQVSRILATVAEEAGEKLPQPVAALRMLTQLKDRFKRFWITEPRAGQRRRLSVALAAAVVLLWLIGLPQLRHWQSNSLVRQAMTDFVAAYSYMDQDQPRSIGGFEYSIMGATRAPAGDFALTDVRATLEKALRRHPQNAAALQSLGTYFLLVENNMKEAARYYELAFAQDSTNARIWCDLGTLAFRQQIYSVAIAKFQTALKYQPQLIEAQYNLALAYEKLGQKERAGLEWQKYRQLDPWQSWGDIAEKHIERLTQ